MRKLVTNLYPLLQGKSRKVVLAAMPSVVLIFSLLFFATNCERPENGGDVPYKPCLCEEEKPLADPQFPQGEAYLFKDSIPAEMEYFLMCNSYLDKSCWIVFDSQTDNAVLTILIEGSISYFCKICNFPDFAKRWNIPENGCMVHFEGIAYEACKPMGGVGILIYRDYILTKLKRE